MSCAGLGQLGVILPVDLCSMNRALLPGGQGGADPGGVQHRGQQQVTTSRRTCRGPWRRAGAGQEDLSSAQESAV